jgi:UDPglucose--hexose-1-phosphate uridylyltransferase
MTSGQGPTGPHRRYDALGGEWILVSADRAARPWLGVTEAASATDLPAFDPGCYLCPGNVRASGARNAEYESTFVFTNDFAALQPGSQTAQTRDGLLRTEPAGGTCRVICFSPRHDLSLARMNAAEIREVVDLWAEQSAELGGEFEWVQVFENRGAAMGASNPHPHGQIWAGATVPAIGTSELETQRRHFEEHGSSLLLDYAAQEAGGPRELEADDEWAVIVPFWATWPFETIVVPRRAVGRLPDLDDIQRNALATRLERLLSGYDALFDMPMPYSMGWHQAPFDGTAHPEWQLHAHFYPPLLEVAVRKFMVGYELLSEAQRDLTPEAAADRLRAAIARSNRSI